MMYKKVQHLSRLIIKFWRIPIKTKNFENQLGKEGCILKTLA